jgi:NAD(P)-dependent dehydrogenase (short-subunit alcohol dehydrogenase family)
MRDADGGRIVNVSSIYGHLAMDGGLYDELLPQAGSEGPVRQPAYHASKGALATLTRELAVALAPWHITVNSVSPGMIHTPGSAPFLTSGIEKSLERRTPSGRFGTPEEIAAAVIYLASDEAAFITGADVRIDGGFSIW